MKLMLKETGETLSISGDWKYLPVAEFKAMNFYVFGEKGKEFHKRPSLEVSLTSHTPTTLFNAMISPLIPFEIKGAIWYQGESNAGNPLQYEKLFPLMIKNWRALWGNEFPFYFVQIAPYDYGESTQSQFLRDAQRKTMKLDNTGMAVTLDIGNFHNIHPANKIDVGTRLALWALAHQYDKPVVFSGPMYKSMKVENNKIILAFDYVEEGLDLRLNDGNTSFEIAGVDAKFHKAEVKIDGDKLAVWSDKIENPKAVRYAWSNMPEATLFNKNGLPASSFRTDDWK